MKDKFLKIKSNKKSKLLVNIISACNYKLNTSILLGSLGRNIKKDIITIEPVYIKNHINKKVNKAQYQPYGNKIGQVAKIDALYKAIKHILRKNLEKSKIKVTKLILMDPSAKKFIQKEADRLLEYNHIIFICGNFKGFDARIYHYVNESFSLGEYILSNGEIASIVIMDVVLRLIPKALGNPKSNILESYNLDLLSNNEYTKPYGFKKQYISKYLFTGQPYLRIQRGYQDSLIRTKINRFDLWSQYKLFDQNFSLS